jgi:hypothetical protein
MGKIVRLEFTEVEAEQVQNLLNFSEDAIEAAIKTDEPDDAINAYLSELLLNRSTTKAWIKMNRAIEISKMANIGR